MSERLLQDIMNLEGVEGVFVVSNRAKVIEKMGLDLKDPQLEALSLRILRIVAGYHKNSQKVNEVEFYWHNLYVIGKISNEFILVTFCKTPKVLSLLRITLNVTLANLLEDKKFGKIIKDHVADRFFSLEKGEIDETEKNLISKLK
ncbi:MAG: hypothetical protein P8X42_12265 [Calditrichaceae bacterium]|jgi:hypothetical protein